MSPKEKLVILAKKHLGEAQDNLYRAKLSFKGMSDTELDCNYGANDKSCREILQEYIEWEEEAKKIVAFAEGL